VTGNRSFSLCLRVRLWGENYDLSISRYKEDVFEEIEYEAPNVILKKLKDLEGEIALELGELEGMIG